MLGIIPYTTLEDRVEKEWDALFIYTSKEQFYFKNNTNLSTEIKEELPDLAFCMQKNVQLLSSLYAPLFKEDEFKELIKKIICQRTFFERSDAFIKKNHCYNTEGIFYEKPYSHFPKIKPGSHIRINQLNPIGPSVLTKPSESDLNATIFHEYGHEMHYQTCKAESSWFQYEEYDTWTSEVLATHTERRIEKDKHSYGYRCYVNLIKKLEKIPEFAVMPFHQQWKKLLEFTTRRELVKYIRSKSSSDH